MNLSELIDRLNKEYLHRKVPIGFGNPHSYRGDYAKLAFEPEIDSNICDMLSACSHALGRDFEGYKGGTYRMDEYTECYLALHGQCGIEIDEALLDRLLAECSPRTDCSCSCYDPVKIENRISNTVQKTEYAGYVLAMCLLQSDLDLDDVEMKAMAQFTQPEVMRRVLRAM